MPTIEEVVEDNTTETTPQNQSGQSAEETPEKQAHDMEEDDDDDNDEDYEDEEEEEDQNDDDEKDQEDDEHEDEKAAFDPTVFMQDVAPLGETIQELVMTKENFIPHLKEQLEKTNSILKNKQFYSEEVERTLYCVGDEMCGLLKNVGVELTATNDCFAPHFKFTRIMDECLTTTGVLVNLLELCSLPWNSLMMYRINEKNSKITIERVRQKVVFPVFVVANSVKGKIEFDEFCKEVMKHSREQGYFDLTLADSIIKENENNSSAINWREKSKEVFKLHLLPSSETLTDDENEKWHQYFVSRTSAQKEHNSLIETEDPEQGEYICRNMMRALKNALRGDNITPNVAGDFGAQLVIKSKDAGYMDFAALQDLTTEVRLYSTHSYQCLDLRYSYYHKTRYYSHDYFAKLEYRILPLAVDSNATEEKDKKKKNDENPWLIFFENYLDEQDQFQIEDWIIVEKRKFLFTLKHLQIVKKAILSNDPDSPYSKVSDIQLLNTMYNASGATNGEDSLLEGDWVGYRMRQLCGCPSKKDYEFEEIDFDKVIEDHLKEIRERREEEEDEEDEEGDEDDDDEYYDEEDEEDEDFKRGYADAQAGFDTFLRNLAGQRGTGKRGAQVPPGCAQQ